MKEKSKVSWNMTLCRFGLLVFVTTLQACDLAHVVTPVEMTHTAIGETFVRIDLYEEREGEVPKSLALLPIRAGHANQVTDGWGRLLVYTITEEGALTLTSFGADGIVGGKGENADITRAEK